jgi:hypothetical protein
LAIECLHAVGAGLRGLPWLPLRGALQWLDRTGCIEVEHGIELIRQPHVEVMADPLCLGRIDHPGHAATPG